MDLREFVSRRIDELLDRFAEQLESAWGNADEEAVHDLRVSIRRLSEALHTMRRLFPKAPVQRIRGRLRTLMDLAAEVRNRDIALELCAAAGLPAELAAFGTMRQERERAAGRLRSTARQWTKRRVPGGWKKVLGATMEPKKGHWRPNDPVEENARRQLPVEVEDYFDAGRKAEDNSPVKLHRFRLRTKRFRYLLELFHPLYSKKLDTLLRRLRKLQNLLGQLNDHAVTRETPAESAELAPLFEYIEKQQTMLLEQLRRYWKDKFDSSGEEKRWKQYVGRPVKRRKGLSR